MARVRSGGWVAAAWGVCLLGGVVGGLSMEPAHASESGTSVYLLGSGGPGTAIMPPVKGVFFANTLYYYSGNAGAERRIPIGGSVVADLDATVVADFPAALWVPSTDFAGGGTLALGMVVPFGRPDVGVSAVISGPQGGAAAGSRQDDAFVGGDPVLTGMLGWSKGDYHWQVSTGASGRTPVAVRTPAVAISAVAGTKAPISTRDSPKVIRPSSGPAQPPCRAMKAAAS